jgi:hypothetical protein
VNIPLVAEPESSLDEDELLDGTLELLGNKAELLLSPLEEELIATVPEDEFCKLEDELPATTPPLLLCPIWFELELPVTSASELELLAVKGQKSTNAPPVPGQTPEIGE